MSIIHATSVVAASGAGPRATLHTFDAFDFTLAPTAAIAGVTLLSSGVQQRIQGGAYTTIGNWLLLGVNSDFEVRSRIDAGAWSGWANLSTSRQWTVETTGAGFQTETATLDLEVRLAASPFTLQGTSTHNLEAITEV